MMLDFFDLYRIPKWILPVSIRRFIAKRSQHVLHPHGTVPLADPRWRPVALQLVAWLPMLEKTGIHIGCGLRENS